jgi:hypothetical protein
MRVIPSGFGRATPACITFHSGAIPTTALSLAIEDPRFLFLILRMRFEICASGLGTSHKICDEGISSGVNTTPRVQPPYSKVSPPKISFITDFIIYPV